MERNQTAPFWLAALVVVGCIGCAVRQPSETKSPDELIQQGTAVAAQLAGRSFRLTPMSAEIEGTRYYGLWIVGDGVMISFTAQAEPHIPSVSGDVVSFGGHTFQAIATPNTFLVDGQSYQLAPGTIYRFHEGQFLGEYRRN